MRVGSGWRSGRHLLARNAWWAAGSLWLAVVMWAFLNGPRIQAAEEQEIAVEAEAENHRVCERLSMPFGSMGYPGCASELGEVRRQQGARLERHGPGML